MNLDGKADVTTSGASSPTPKRTGDFTSFQLKYTLHKDVDSTQRGHTAIFCDYDSGEWNYRQFITWISEHLPTFALNSKEIRALGDRTMIDQTERAAGNIYSKRHKPANRGEVGELILHGLIRDIYNTTPLISKIYRKTAFGDTVKGADCVHIIEVGGEIDSLWLGESKFKDNASDGIREAVESVSGMLDSLDNWEEFIVIRQHLDDDLPITSKIESLLSKTTSLDEIKTKICVPILVTYDSKVTAKYSKYGDDFKRELDAEIQPHIENFLKKTAHISEVDVHIFLMPLKAKMDLIKIFDRFIDSKRAIDYGP